jgi:hypothetical protein
MEKDRTDDGSRRTDGLSDLLRGAISSSVRSVFMTEEGVRSVLAEWIPRELGVYIRTQVDSAKKEVYQAFVTELTRFLKEVDLGHELREALGGMKVRVQMDIEFQPNPTKATKKSKTAPVT